MFVDIIKVFSL